MYNPCLDLQLEIIFPEGYRPLLAPSMGKPKVGFSVLDYPRNDATFEVEKLKKQNAFEIHEKATKSSVKLRVFRPKVALRYRISW